MSAKTSLLEEQADLRSFALSGAIRAATFALAIFVSAFLLFQVQPLVGKFILPWFGGSPAVWTTCMLFFQVTLFLGYAYAHATSRWLTAGQQRTVHLILIVLAVLVLPIAPDHRWKPLDSEQPVQRILLLLTATVGLSYFVLSSTGPLLQSWFSRVCPDRSPYRLYALSNAGSLLALASYPLIVEPLWTSKTQANLWSIGFIGFALLCAICAVWASQIPTNQEKIATGASLELAPRLWRRLLWLLLPVCSCLMLVATTNEVTQDVAPIPFLWVIPLGLYLLSFIICFDHETWYRREIIAPLTAIAIVLLAGLQYWPEWLGWSLSTTGELAIYFAALFGVCMVCHGEVVRIRPSPRYLTEFYLLLSAGGAVGGIFVSLIAPLLFKSYFEWTIGLVASFVLASAVSTLTLRERISSLQQDRSKTIDRRYPLSRSSMLLVSAIAMEVLALAQILFWQIGFDDSLYSGRNFYGTVHVVDWTTDENEPFRAFLSGHINHGRQWVSEEKRRIPTTYYGEGTGAGVATALVQSRPNVRIGVVGLGVGTMAAYARPGDSIRFYEINPEVTWIANNYFWFLRDCRGTHEVVMGDARLMLEREPPNDFDLLILDAFTSDAPPIHLLTSEAFELYDRHLASHGLLAVNVTNTYLELAPVVARLGHDRGWKSVRIRTETNPSQLAYRTDYVVFAREADALIELKNREMIAERNILAAPAWTDQYSNLFQILKSP